MTHVNDQEWKPPELPDSSLVLAFGSSIVEEFARGHNAADVLRELVQNEYDAQGDTLEVVFGSEGLEVHGNGRVIDQPGWRRLSVMMGTGSVAGGTRDVPQKVNGIGSKNHGLRALFLIGDRIFVRSGGLQTLLDRRLGAPPAPSPDPTSQHLNGVHIFVPYRRDSGGRLEAYTAERETRDMDLLGASIAPVLVKLAQPDARHSVRALTVTSERGELSLRWRQKTRQVKRLPGGGDLVERSMELRRRSPSASASSAARIVELEYRRSFKIPDQFREQTFPSYFRAAKGRLRIGLSLRLKRKRPDLQDAGSFYYPLGLPNGATGSAISVSAPFEVNADRSALIDAETSSWNRWLAEQSADFALDLLTREWLDAFGGDAFLLLRPRLQSPATRFAEHISTGLKERECWPCRERLVGSRRARLQAAHELMIGASPESDALLSDGRRLDERAASGDVAGMARTAGAKDFTLASAIRLRCAGSNNADLQTRLGGDANLHYVSFPEALKDLGLQKLFSAAFDANQRHLTSANRGDLLRSPTTLTAAGTLAAPSLPLWVVDEALTAASPVAVSQRLHPALTQSKVLSRLCRSFDSSAWAAEVAVRATEGTVSTEDREALYRYLLANPDAIRQSAWPKLRGAPIMLDKRGQWASPAAMVHPRAVGAARLERALQFPGREILSCPGLLKRLRIRSKLKGSDLISYARLVAEQPHLAEGIEDALYQLRGLLTRSTVTTLRSIPFLPSTRGAVAPADAYVRTPHMVKCVGPEACFATGRRTALQERLGCRTAPEADDIVAFLDRLRSTGEGPPDPDVAYAALLEALQRDGNTRRFSDTPILFSAGKWHAPNDVLIGRKHEDVFLGGVPIVRATRLKGVFQALGAATEPTPDHWLAFFSWLDERSDEGRAALAQRERRALLRAYAMLGSLPTAVPDSYHVLLDTSGRLHSLDDVRAKRYLINDDPGLAQAAQEAGLTISFADTPDAPSRRFCRSSGVALVSEARERVGHRLGQQRSGPAWFEESSVLVKLHDPLFASTVHAVAASGGSRTATNERELQRGLAGITGITFVTEIEKTYRIGGLRVGVPASWELDGQVIALCYLKGRPELHGLLALAVASMAEGQQALRQPLTDSVFRLLTCDSSGEMQRYLKQRGIPWRAAVEPGSEEEEDAIERTEAIKTLTEQLIRETGAGASERPSEPPAAEREVNERTGQPRMLPPIGVVILEEAGAADWSPSEREPSGRGRRRRSWSPRTPTEEEDDRALGERGEEIVYLAELERVRELGYPEDRVTWASKDDPAANHDIRSVADDGGDLWLEVKSTTGRHGRFEWSRGEFALAVAVRERYVLCRVYEADTDHPRVRREVNPIATWLAGEMRLDVSSLSAEIAPMSE